MQNETKPSSTLKLEAGKRYIMRNGWITPPLQFDDELNQTYPFLCGTDFARSWTPEGKYFSGDVETGREDTDDIVAEFVVDASVVPGVPDGFRIVGYKEMQKGNRWLSPVGPVESYFPTSGFMAIIIERINP
jgi:hypothetical protein